MIFVLVIGQGAGSAPRQPVPNSAAALLGCLQRLPPLADKLVMSSA